MTDGATGSRREYPEAPIVGVAGVVVQDGRVLLIRRGRPPMLGGWSLPGGALELGETMAEGVVREVFEETGVRVRPIEILVTLDRIVHDAARRVQFHYLLVDWLCAVESGDGEPLMAGDDAQAAVWAGREELRSAADHPGDDKGGFGHYSLETVTLRVIEDGFLRAEALRL